jgi:hypothetical protein
MEKVKAHRLATDQYFQAIELAEAKFEETLTCHARTCTAPCRLPEHSET